jgi:arylsulfatase A-like enzyme
MAPPEFARLYDPAKIELPGNFMPRHPFDNGEMEIRDEKLTALPRDPATIRMEIAGYYAMISHLDREIGRVLDALVKTGLAENTIVVFAGDNGLAVGQHGLLGKQNIYDHSVRVPLIIGGPGIPKGKKAETFCYLLDVYPTLCRLLGIEAPATAEGTSLVPALRDPSAKVRKALFLAYTKLQRGLKTSDNWKLIRYMANGIETVQLFNLNIDPLEIRNLAARPEEAGRVARMSAELNVRMKEAGDFCDLDKPHWN